MGKPSASELLKTNRRFRKQQGTIVERTDGFYLRYNKTSDGVQTKVTEKLCDKGKDFPSADCHSVTVLRDLLMAQVNAEHHNEIASPAPLPKEPPLTIGAFVLTTYLPWAKNNLRHSTWHGYEKCWNHYVKDDLEAKPLNEYRTIDASEFLTGLATPRTGPDGEKRVGLNRNTLAHVRSLMSGIFKVAINTKGSNGKALIDQNPMHDVKVLVKIREPTKRVAYTLDEIITILNAVTRTDAKLFFALCSVLGMRPSEAAAVKWENIDLDGAVLKVREAAPYGVLGELKTDQSEGDLPIIEPVLSFLKALHRERQEPRAGFLFTPDGKNPINHSAFARRWIKPEAEKVCPRWNGCYSGRHGAATDLYNSTGDVRAAFQVLRNSLEVVIDTYVHPNVEQGQAGLKTREQQFLKAMKKVDK